MSIYLNSKFKLILSFVLLLASIEFIFIQINKKLDSEFNYYREEYERRSDFNLFMKNLVDARSNLVEGLDIDLDVQKRRQAFLVILNKVMSHLPDAVILEKLDVGKSSVEIILTNATQLTLKKACIDITSKNIDCYFQALHKNAYLTDAYQISIEYDIDLVDEQ